MFYYERCYFYNNSLACCVAYWYKLCFPQPYSQHAHNQTDVLFWSPPTDTEKRRHRAVKSNESKKRRTEQINGTSCEIEEKNELPAFHFRWKLFIRPDGYIASLMVLAKEEKRDISFYIFCCFCRSTVRVRFEVFLTLSLTQFHYRFYIRSRN